MLSFIQDNGFVSEYTNKFNMNHPELRTGERFYSNYDASIPDSMDYYEARVLADPTIRKGEKAYLGDGKPAWESLFPVFCASPSQPPNP